MPGTQIHYSISNCVDQNIGWFDITERSKISSLKIRQEFVPLSCKSLAIVVHGCYDNINNHQNSRIFLLCCPTNSYLYSHNDICIPISQKEGTVGPRVTKSDQDSRGRRIRFPFGHTAEEQVGWETLLQIHLKNTNCHTL